MWVLAPGTHSFLNLEQRMAQGSPGEPAFQEDGKTAFWSQFGNGTVGVWVLGCGVGGGGQKQLCGVNPLLSTLLGSGTLTGHQACVASALTLSQIACS